MSGPKVRLTTLLLTIFISCSVNAQTKKLSSFQDLSGGYYRKQKDSLKKAWACPAVFKNKETQAKYKEIWEGRTDFITRSISDNDFIYNREIVNYVQGIIDQIVLANNVLIPVKPLLLIDRDESVNAYALGGNIIVVNLGLISFAHSREDLALTIAHELSHNILAHPENGMKQRAEWLTSDEYKQSLNAILDSKYERLTRLKKVFEGYSFNRSRHQRYHEGDADSLAIVLLKKSNIAVEAAFFLRLDSADIQYKQSLKTPVKEYFSVYNLPFEDAWGQKRSKGLSTRAYNFKDTTHIQDSLKTHPDCVERYKRTLPSVSVGTPATPVPEGVTNMSNKLLIWTMYCNMKLTPCLFRILTEKDKGNTDAWYDFMLHNIFAGLSYSDRELHRFSAIDVQPKEYISKDYYELQTMLEQIPRESLEQYCKLLQQASFWKDMTQEETDLKKLMYTLATDPEEDKNKAAVAEAYTAKNSTSLYCEFAKTLEKK